jgi:hypothetical protein
LIPTADRPPSSYCILVVGLVVLPFHFLFDLVFNFNFIYFKVLVITIILTITCGTTGTGRGLPFRPVPDPFCVLGSRSRVDPAAAPRLGGRQQGRIRRVTAVRRIVALKSYGSSSYHRARLEGGSCDQDRDEDRDVDSAVG